MKNNSLMRLLKRALPYWKIILLCMLCVLLVNMAELYKPLIMERVIDDFLIGSKPERGLYSITGMGIIYLLLIAVSSGLTVFQVNAINHVGQSIVTDLRRTVFSHIHRMPLSVLDKYSSGRLYYTATNDVEALSELFTDVIIDLFGMFSFLQAS